MSFENLVHTYKGKSFEGIELQHLAPTFSESFFSAVKQHGHKRFIKVYDGAQTTEKTFAEFSQDVHSARGHIEKHLKSETILVTLASNTYLHAVYIIAAHLSNLTVCPISANEPAEGVQKKLKLLPGAATIWSEVERSDLTELETYVMTTEAGSEPKRESAFPPQQPMVLIFTSGSTGYSKIVEQMEFNVLTNVDALIGHHQLATYPAPVIATSLPLFHVNTLEFSFFSSLLAGCQLVIYKKFDIGVVARSLQQDRVTILSLMPTLLKILIDRSSDFINLSKPHLKYVISAAAPLSGKTANAFLDLYQIPILQGYGLSEAVNFSAILPVPDSFEEHRKWLTSYEHPSIGPALRGNEIHILDEGGQPCEEGKTGEVCVRGWNVMRKYTGETGELFKDGFLHTGDVGYFHLHPSGTPYYFISGRIKDVIKRNGETVSLREVDDLVLASLFPGTDAIAVGFLNDLAGEELGLIVSMQAKSEQDTLLSALETLPKLLRPSVVLFCNQVLRTPSGKPQRWRFQSFFRKYQTVFLGSRMKSEDIYE